MRNKISNRLLSFLNSKYILYFVMIGLTAAYLNHFFSPEWWNTDLGGFDWDQHFFYLESTRKPIIDFKQFPFWNPYYAGGIPILENPQIKFFAPTNLFSFFMGSVKGLKISILFYHLAGVLGCIHLFRNVLKFRTLPTLLSSILFLFCGWHSQQIFPGHSQFFSTPLLPFIAGFLVRFNTERKFKDCFSASLFMTILLSEGNIYIFLYLNLFLSLLVVYYFLTKETRFIAFNILKFLFLTFLLSSYRLFPEMDYFFHYGAFYKADTLSLNIFNAWDIFTNASQHPFLAVPIAGQEYRWWEYGNYIGVLPFLIFVSLIGFTKKNELPFLILLVLSLLLMLGNFHTFSPANLLSHIPGFSNIRCYARWSIVFVFIFSVLIGINLNRFIDKMFFYPNFQRSDSIKALFYTFLSAICIYFYTDISKKNGKNFKNIFIYSNVIVSENTQNFETRNSFPSYGADSSLLTGIFQNKSTRDAYENLLSNRNLPAAGDKNYRGEFFLTSGDVIKQTYWSPGELHFHTNVSKPGKLIINQNYNEQWKASSGHDIKNINGLIGVELLQGENNIVLYYLSDYFLLGSLLSITGLAFSIFWIFRQKSKNNPILF